QLEPGQRIVVSGARHGTVRYAGEAAFAPGDWVGVELDDYSAKGAKDGSVRGMRYFECAMGHGIFIRPSAATIIAPAPAPA
ncbi:CAP Gly-rich domain-containing protein, partial [Podospora conica]